NNACQALGDPKGHIEVRTGGQMIRGIHFAELSVRDSGPGIPVNLQEQIFEPFFTTKKEGQGTGLGLSFSRDFVRRLGGDIICESEPGSGALFRVLLPMVAEKSLEGEVAS